MNEAKTRLQHIREGIQVVQNQPLPARQRRRQNRRPLEVILAGQGVPDMANQQQGGDNLLPPNIVPVGDAGDGNLDNNLPIHDNLAPQGLNVIPGDGAVNDHVGGLENRHLYRDMKSLQIATFSNFSHEDPTLWLLTFKHKITALQIPPERAAQLLGLHLANQCINWFLALPQDTKQDYEALLAEFERKYIFGTDIQKQTTRAKYFSASQNVGETVEDWADRIRQLGIRVDLVNDDILTSKFMAGLLPNIRNRIALFPIQNLAHAVDMAKSAVIQIQSTEGEVHNHQVFNTTAKAEATSVQKILDRLDNLTTHIKKNTEVHLTSTDTSNTERQQNRPNRQMTSVNDFQDGNYRSNYTPRFPPRYPQQRFTRYPRVNQTRPTYQAYQPRARFTSQPPRQWRPANGFRPQPRTQSQGPPNGRMDTRRVCYRCGGYNHLQQHCTMPSN